MKHTPHLTDLILDQAGKPTQLFQDILCAAHINHANSLASIVEATQKAWLRPAHVERWDMANTQDDSNERLVSLLSELHFNQEIAPTDTTYDYVLVLGDTLNGMRLRFSYALTLWNIGVRFNNLFFLTSQRERFDDHIHILERESEHELYDVTNPYLPIKKDWLKPITAPKTETDIARMIVDQTELPLSFAQNVAIHFIDTPYQHTENGLRRPNTGDTFKLWIKSIQPHGKVLAISSQPYVGYQHAVLKTYVPNTMSIVTVGPASQQAQPTHLLLDTLARWLFQEHIFQKKLHVKM